MSKTLRATPVYLTDAVRKRLKMAAAEHDTTMTAIAAEAIEKALDRLDKSVTPEGRS